MEITKPVELCTKLGRLNHSALGWARKPLVRCNLKGHLFRKKKWNYWAVYNKNYLFSVTVADLDYLGISFWYFVDFKEQKMWERSFITPFGIGYEMPETPEESVFFETRNFKIHMIRKAQITELFVEDHRRENLSAKFEIFHQNFESLNVVVPWSWNRFQFTSKQFSLMARGEVIFEDRKIRFDESESFATLDFGRGVWKYKTTWNWASFATRLSDGTVIGVNLGGKWTDKTGINENGLLVNGKLTKIESDVVFSYDLDDLMNLWKIYSINSDEVQLEFKPVFLRNSKTNFLIVASKMNQLFGFFKGFVRDENRRVYLIEDAFGWVEDHYARW